VEQLTDGKYYWVKIKDRWEIARFDYKYSQFQFTGRTIYGVKDVKEIDYKPIEKQ
jgi:hypothetical protein